MKRKGHETPVRKYDRHRQPAISYQLLEITPGSPERGARYKVKNLRNGNVRELTRSGYKLLQKQHRIE